MCVCVFVVHTTFCLNRLFLFLQIQVSHLNNNCAVIMLGGRPLTYFKERWAFCVELTCLVLAVCLVHRALFTSGPGNTGCSGAQSPAGVTMI